MQNKNEKDYSEHSSAKISFPSDALKRNSPD